MREYDADTADRKPEPPLILRAEKLAASDFHPLDQRWLWHPYIPDAHVTVLIGDPGIGKSLLLTHLAACITTARPFPTPAPNSALPRRPGDVIFGAPEDCENDVFVPRLTAAGADLDRVHVIARVKGYLPRRHYKRNDPNPDEPVSAESGTYPLTLPLHAAALAREAINDVCLLVLDPLHNFIARVRNARHFDLAGGDIYIRNSQDLTTSVMAALTTIARSGRAVIAVAHLTKASAPKLLLRARGSLSLVSAARSVLYLAADPHHPDRRILSQIKSISGPLAPPIAFRIQPGPRLEFEPPGSVSQSAESLALPAEDFSALSEACAWLTDALSSGPRPATDMLTESRALGISSSTLNRAKFLLRVRSLKFDNHWHWSISESVAEGTLSK